MKKSNKKHRKNNNYKNRQINTNVTQFKDIDKTDVSNTECICLPIEPTNYVNFKSELIEKTLEKIEQDKLYKMYIQICFILDISDVSAFRKYLKQLLLEHPELIYYTRLVAPKNEMTLEIGQNVYSVNIGARGMVHLALECEDTDKARAQLFMRILHRLEEYMLERNFSIKEIDNLIHNSFIKE